MHMIASASMSAARAHIGKRLRPAPASASAPKPRRLIPDECSPDERSDVHMKPLAANLRRQYRPHFGWVEAAGRAAQFDVGGYGIQVNCGSTNLDLPDEAVNANSVGGE